MEFDNYCFLTKTLYFKKNGIIEGKELDLKDADTITKVQVICQELENGEPLTEICTGKEWRPTVRKFFEILDTDKSYKRLYKNALRAFSESLKAKIFITPLEKKDKELIKELKDAYKLVLSEIETAEKQLKAREIEDGREVVFELNSPYANIYG